MLVFESLLPTGDGASWEIETFTQTTNFTGGTVVLTLAQTPISPKAVIVDYNGQRKYHGTHWSVSGNQVTILFDDPYVTDYDENPQFNIQYQY